MRWPGAPSLAVMAGLAGFTAVVMAALGSHLDGGIDDAASAQAWQSAVLMHGLHALALLALSAAEQARSDVWWRAAGLSMALGILAFSGSLYAGVILEQSSPLAPMGGLLLMAGWIMITVAGIRQGRHRS